MRMVHLARHAKFSAVTHGFMSELKGGLRRRWRKAAMRAAVGAEAFHRLTTGTIQLPRQRGELLIPHNPRNYVEEAKLSNPTWNKRVNKQAGRIVEQRNQQMREDLFGPVWPNNRSNKLMLRNALDSLTPPQRQQLVRENKQAAAWTRRMQLSGERMIGPRIAHDQTHMHAVGGKRPLGVSQGDEYVGWLYEKALDASIQGRAFDVKGASAVSGMSPKVVQRIADRAKRRWEDPVERVHDTQVRLANARRGNNLLDADDYEHRRNIPFGYTGKSRSGIFATFN